MAMRPANVSPLVDEGGAASAVVVAVEVEKVGGAPQPGNPLATGAAEFGTAVAAAGGTAGGGGAATVG